MLFSSLQDDNIEYLFLCALHLTRTSFLFRGLGAMLNKNIKTAQSWADLAQEAIRLDKDICRM